MMLSRRAIFAAALAGVSMPIASAWGQTDTWPTRPIKFIVPLTPERYMEIMKADIVKYARIVREAKIKVE